MNSLIRKSVLMATAFAAAILPKAQAQDERDALRFSFLQPQGTARSIGFGSALGSVGGDFSSLAVNPAGIGVYRRSEVTFTPSLTFTKTSADYAANGTDANGTHFAISNIGLVTTQVPRGRRAVRTGWTSVSFGVGLTRLADFTRSYDYSGINTTSSGSFAFEASANQSGLNPDYNATIGDLGYQTYLLNKYDSTRYISVVNPTQATPVRQLTSVTERGGISELGISLGGSYEDRLMLGATLGFPIVRYTRTKTFTERDLSGNGANGFDYFTFSDDLKTTGGGVNLKLGFIYKPIDNFRFGAAIHTPTFLSLTDIWNQSLTANTEEVNGTTTAAMPENQYDYSLTTPWRAVLSATAFLGGYGFFTLDYEFVDYASARFTFDDKDYQSDVNNVIKKNFQGASNIRTGLEIRLDNFQIRGGFGYYGNPYKNTTNDASGERLDFSTGLGFRFQNAFIDLGFVHHEYKSTEQPYYLSGAAYSSLIIPTANLTTNANNAVVTFGFKL
jgi:hypothetical protein